MRSAHPKQCAVGPSTLRSLPNQFHLSWYFKQPVIIWVAEAITLLVDFCCLPSSLSLHYPLWPALTMVSWQAETTTKQYREENVWDTDCALELALDSETQSCRQQGLSGSQQTKLSHSSALTAHKGSCSLSNTARRSQSSPVQ